MKYIDAHVHVWTDDFDRYPLCPPFQESDMNPKPSTPKNSLPTPNHRALIGLCLSR